MATSLTGEAKTRVHERDTSLGFEDGVKVSALACDSDLGTLGSEICPQLLWRTFLPPDSFAQVVTFINAAL